MRKGPAIIVLSILSFFACQKSNLDVRNAEITVLNYRIVDAFPKAEGGYYLLVKENLLVDSFAVLDISSKGELMKARAAGSSSDEAINDFINVNRIDATTASVLVQAESGDSIRFVTVSSQQDASSQTDFVSNPFSGDWNRIESKDHVKVDGFFYVLSYLFNPSQDFYLGIARFLEDGSADPMFSVKTYYISQFDNTDGPAILRLINLEEGGFMILADGRGDDHAGLVLRLGPDGNEMWRLYLQSDNFDIVGLNDVQQVPNSNQVQLLGSTASGYVYLARIHSGNGDLVDEDFIPATGAVQPKSIQILDDGSQLISADVQVPSEDNTDLNFTHTNIRLWKLDPNGNELFSETYGGGFDVKAVYAFQNPDKSILIVGGSQTFGLEQFNDLLLIRTNQMGLLVK